MFRLRTWNFEVRVGTSMFNLLGQTSKFDVPPPTITSHILPFLFFSFFLFLSCVFFFFPHQTSKQLRCSNLEREVGTLKSGFKVQCSPPPAPANHCFFHFFSFFFFFFFLLFFSTPNFEARLQTVTEAARARVTALEAAISALGSADEAA